MFDSISNLCLFGIIKPIQCAYQITGNPSDPIEFHLAFMTAAGRADISYNAGKSADRISVNWVVYRAITYSAFIARIIFSKAPRLFRDYVKLHIGNMSCIGKLVIGSPADLVKCKDL